MEVPEISEENKSFFIKEQPISVSPTAIDSPSKKSENNPDKTPDSNVDIIPPSVKSTAFI